MKQIFQGEMPRHTSHILTRRLATEPPYFLKTATSEKELCLRLQTLEIWSTSSLLLSHCKNETLSTIAQRKIVQSQLSFSELASEACDEEEAAELNPPGGACG